MLKAESLKKSYGSLQVLKGVDIEIRKGEVVCIVGASGAGKSTLLHILGTLDNPDSGKVEMDGKNVFGQGSRSLAEFRNKNLGFVFQFHNLLPEFSAIENVMIPGLIGKHQHRIIYKCAGNGYTLLLPTRKLGWFMIGPCFQAQ